MTTINPAELARETFKTLVQRKLLPTPDNYTLVYNEISGITNAPTASEQALQKIATLFAKQPKLRQTSVELEKAIEHADWSAYLAEIENSLQTSARVQAWHSLIKDLLRQLDTPHKGITLSRKKEGVETVLNRFASNPENLFEKLGNLIRSWSEGGETQTTELVTVQPSPNATTEDNQAITSASSNPDAAASPNGNEVLGKISELLAQTLESMLSSQPDLAAEVQQFSEQARNIKTHEDVTTLAKQLRPFWIKVELRGGDRARIHEGLIHLLRLLVENIGEMVQDEEWLRGQITILQEIIAKPLDKGAIADAESNLRHAISKQSMLKQNMSDAKATLKGLMTTFIDRLGEMTNTTGEYHQKIEDYSGKIKATQNLTDLSLLLEDIMRDTRNIQSSTRNTHEELLSTRKEAEDAEARIRELEQELARVSQLVHQDQLTGALNRRGMEDAFERETTRADRAQLPICVALLDIDNFKRLNDTLGHQAGDQALVHLCSVIKESLRPSDSVARYGGEEFIIILPELSVQEAAHAIERLQRELTKRFFLHANDKILITFSAGVAQRNLHEPPEQVIGRADHAMYQAKKTGKNRVVIAQ